MIRVMTIFGTRPEAIKMAPLIEELQKYPDKIQPIVCLTSQHKEMLEQVLEVFKIVPDYNLNVMKENQSLSGLTSNMLDSLNTIIQTCMPDLILVQGDTTTAFVGGLAAFYNKVRVGHIEAGLRTFDKYFPYPEEINRRLISTMADLHFAPTQLNKRNLMKENIDPSKIFVTGNTIIDSFRTTVHPNYTFSNTTLNSLDFNSKKVVLITAHRRENLGKPLENICRAIKRLVENCEDIIVVYPVHLNPLVREVVFEILHDHQRIKLIEPIRVDELHNLINKIYMVLTDSGGLQEEAPAFRKPVLLLRKETERMEGVEAGAVKIVGVDENEIFIEGLRLINDADAYLKMSKATNPYGDGHASERILAVILNELT